MLLKAGNNLTYILLHASSCYSHQGPFDVLPGFQSLVLLALYPGGHANSVERDSENGATWEVEVAKADGGTVDVRLDQNYQLVVAESDSGDQGGN